MTRPLAGQSTPTICAVGRPWRPESSTPPSPTPVLFFGDEVAVVVAEDEVAAAQAARLVKVDYDEYPFVLDVQKAMEPDAPQIHEEYPGNVLAHTQIRSGDYEAAAKEPGLIKVEGW